MNRKTALIMVFVCGGLFLCAGMAMGDDDDHDSGHEGEHGFFSGMFREEHENVPNPKSDLYSEECGSCHFPYQPGLLGEKAWLQVMANLESHFDENAELADDERIAILNYLQENAASRSDNVLPVRATGNRSGTNNSLRITQTRYFKYEHSEIPLSMVKENPGVNSFSNCDSCHQKADQGLYDDDYVRIPGYGRWDD
ncbi:MAG: cytochrome C [Candidatus Sedimenticola sp. 20ELBAFRAG]